VCGKESGTVVVLRVSWISWCREVENRMLMVPASLKVRHVGTSGAPSLSTCK